MADGRDDRNMRIGNGAGHAFVVEGPKVLHGAAAAAGDDEVGQLPAVGVADRPGDLRRSLGPLHADAEQLDLRQRVALAQDAQHVVQSRARGGRDDGDAVREARQGLLALAGEQALSLQLQLELLKGDMQIADALRRERRAVELVGSVTREHGNAPARNDLHTRLRPETQAHGAALEHDAADGALAVLQREIVMAGGVNFIVAQLTADEQRAEKFVCFKALSQILVDLRYLKDLSHAARQRRGRCPWRTAADRKRPEAPRSCCAAACSMQHRLQTRRCCRDIPAARSPSRGRWRR